MNSYSAKVVGYAGHRARDPPDPIPNSEVKPRSVSGVSVVFGHAKPGKLAAPHFSFTNSWRENTQNLLPTMYCLL